MKIRTEELIFDLIERTKHTFNKAERLKSIPIEKLNSRPSAESWSALECLEHLNLYGEYYLPEIRNRIKNSKFQPEEFFYSGLLGNYFSKSMLPKENLKKIKTFKDKDPIGSQLDLSTLKRFLEQQKTLMELLEHSKNVSLNKTKTAISISRFIKLKLGDTFRVLVYHNQRHLIQAQKALGAKI
ncbi:MAG: DinB family protein [Gillisia sp.]